MPKTPHDLQLQFNQNIILKMEDDIRSEVKLNAAPTWTAENDDLDYRLKLTKFNINKLRVRTQACINTCRLLNLYNMLGEFQMSASFSQDMEYQSQDSQGNSSSQEESLQGGKGNWKCPKCPKGYQSQKTLKNHLEKKHGVKGEELGYEENSQAMAVDEPVDEATGGARKRKDRDDDSGDEGAKPRARLETISEEVENLNLNLLDDTFSSPMKEQSTQGLVSEAARLYEEAERIEVNIEEAASANDSIEADKDKALDDYEKKLKLRDSILHSRNALIAQREAELAEARELIEIRERTIKKNKKEIEDKTKEVEAMAARLNEVEERMVVLERKKENSPEKEVLKESIQKSNEAIRHLKNRVVNLSTDLQNANKSVRRSENDIKCQEKLKENFEHTLRKLSEVESELDEFKKEKAILQKRIPCTLKDCQKGRNCVYSHQLAYEEKTEPKEKNWRKRVACRFFMSPEGCFKTDEECNFIHPRGEPAAKLRNEERRSYERDEARRSREIEVTFDNNARGDEERRDRRDVKMDNSKRRRLNAKEGWEQDDLSGNGRGVSGASRQETPDYHSRQRSESRETSMTSSRGRSPKGEKEKGSGSNSRRKWSPIKSPEEDRVRPRTREDQNGGYQGGARRGRDRSAQGRRGDRYQRGGRQSFKGRDPWI